MDYQCDKATVTAQICLVQMCWITVMPSIFTTWNQ